MTQATSQLDMPERRDTAAGTVRRVGFELEFSGISLDTAANVVREQFDGVLLEQSAAEILVSTELGDFNIEIDWDFLKRTAAAAGHSADELLDKVSKAAAMVVPVEVVCPPIAMTAMDQLQGMVAALRDAGAVGTEESLIAAYGVHINPESPDLDASTIDNYLRAFCLLQWWLAEQSDVDLARRLSPYIDLFDESYIRVLLSRERPDMDTLIDDYLAHNATRNRALDMLPLFAEVDADRVRAVIDDPKIKPRPTFHYRLPNCRIDDPEWSLASSWNLWCEVERLANDDTSLRSLGAEFDNAHRPILGVDRSAWVERMSQWCNGHS